jgi:hypothetical protein
LIVDGDVRIIESNAAPLAAALQRGSRLRPVDEDVSHRDRRDGEEVGAVTPIRPRLIDQLEVGLVDEGGRGQRAASCASRELAVCNDAQLVVDERNELVDCPVAAAAQLHEQVVARGRFPRLVSISTRRFRRRLRNGRDVVFRHGLSLIPEGGAYRRWLEHETGVGRTQRRCLFHHTSER